MADGIKISELAEIETLQDGCCFPVISEVNGSMQNVKIKKMNLEKNLASNVYSTEEIVVGKWIDGRPVYRKVYVYYPPKINFIIDSSLNNNNCAIIKYSGFFKYLDKFIFMPSYNNTTTGWDKFDAEILFDENGIKHATSLVNNTTTLIIDYIKN